MKKKNFFFKYTENKSFCEDLSEGKFSFPIIHAIRTHPEDRQIMSILFHRFCIKTFETFSAFSYLNVSLFIFHYLFIFFLTQLMRRYSPPSNYGRRGKTILRYASRKIWIFRSHEGSFGGTGHES